MIYTSFSPRIRASALVAGWAQEIGLPVGNLWEPGIIGPVLKHWVEYGEDAEAWRLVEQEYRYRFGLGL
jgi:hypothetical protein